jgi:hypothetical protein
VVSQSHGHLRFPLVVLVRTRIYWCGNGITPTFLLKRVMCASCRARTALLGWRVARRGRQLLHSTHSVPAVDTLLEAHPLVEFHFTPRQRLVAEHRRGLVRRVRPQVRAPLLLRQCAGPSAPQRALSRRMEQAPHARLSGPRSRPRSSAWRCAAALTGLRGSDSSGSGGPRVKAINVKGIELRISGRVPSRGRAAPHPTRPVRSGFASNAFQSSVSNAFL